MAQLWRKEAGSPAILCQAGSDSLGTFSRPEVAARYATEQLFAAGEELATIVRLARPRGFEAVLDLGAAAGHVALALAPHVRLVIALDPATAMLREAQRLAAERGATNLRLVSALADPVPFNDAEFDLVTCRYAAHHFPDLPGALYEVARVLKPGGRFYVVDTVAPEEPALDEFVNEIELLRDSSHARDYRLSEWQSALAGFGLRYELHARWLLPLAFDDWVARVGTPPAGVERLRERFDAAPGAAVGALRITREPRRAFALHAALFSGTRA